MEVEFVWPIYRKTGVIEVHFIAQEAGEADPKLGYFFDPVPDALQVMTELADEWDEILQYAIDQLADKIREEKRNVS